VAGYNPVALVVSGGYDTNTSFNGTGMIRLAVQAQLLTAPASHFRNA
jgi:hypothetical protein